mgnify:FL=1
MEQVLPVPSPFLDVRVIYRGQVDGTVDLNDAIKVPDSANSVPDKAEKVPDTMKKMPNSSNEMPDTAGKIGLSLLLKRKENNAAWIQIK